MPKISEDGLHSASLKLVWLCSHLHHLCHKIKKDMATREQLEALKIDNNVFELAEDTELKYLIHFAAPGTGADKCLVPKGTAFAPHSPMRDDALYMHTVDEDDEELYAKMAAQVKDNYEDLFDRLQGFSFYITEEQLKTLPLKFRSGSAERLLDIMRQLRSPVCPL